MQVGKGRDVGMNQISSFEAKVANGNGEQTLSRDIYRLGRRFDFYRMLSFYFTTVGFYFSSMVRNYNNNWRSLETYGQWLHYKYLPRAQKVARALLELKENLNYRIYLQNLMEKRKYYSELP